jgi:hypothetical protein
VTECPTCQGCGLVTDTTMRLPWSYWLCLPLAANGGVLGGRVHAITCPRCDGSGKEPTP